MHGVFASGRAALLYLLAWLMLGLLLGAMLALTGAGWAPSLLFALPLALVYACATGFSAYYVCRAYPLGQRRVAAIAGGIALTALFAAGLWCAAGVAWNSLWQALAPGLALDLAPPVTASMFGLGVLLYGLAAAVNYLMIESERVRQLETRELQVRLMARDAELQMLRSQVDPHFLFNSLNSVSALISIDPPAARAMIHQLADFFRHSLGLRLERKVALAQELEQVAHFIAIEQVRFGPRLRFEAEVDEDARACLLPPMLLQPLVENAVKHGIGQMVEAGTIRLRARRAGTLLAIRIDNDIDPDSAGKPGTGLGLDNVRQRLAAAYGQEASASWSKTGQRFRVELTLPAQTENQTTEA